MKNVWKVALAVAALAGSASVAKADVTLTGQTGLFLNPTAQVAAQGGGEVAADYQRFSDHGFHSNAYGIVGAAGIADKLEVNGGFHAQSNDLSNYWNVGAKYKVLDQAEKGFGLAVGADYGKVTDGGGHTADVYAAATKTFGNDFNRAPIQGTLGVRYNDYSGGSDKVDVFAGVAVPVSSNGEFSLIGEIGSKRYNGGETEYAVGGRWHPKGQEFNVGAGVVRHGFFVQAGYRFGKS